MHRPLSFSPWSWEWSIYPLGILNLSTITSSFFISQDGSFCYAGIVSPLPGACNSLWWTGICSFRRSIWPPYWNCFGKEQHSTHPHPLLKSAITIWSYGFTAFVSINPVLCSLTGRCKYVFAEALYQGSDAYQSLYFEYISPTRTYLVIPPLST